MMEILRIQHDQVRNSASVVYVSLANESILGSMINRSTRPWKAWQEVIQPVLFKELDLSPETHVLEWNQKAGCSCGCSPGFNIRSKKARRLLRGSRIWVDLDCAPEEMVELSPEADRIRAARLASVQGDPALAPLLQGAKQQSTAIH